MNNDYLNALEQLNVEYNNLLNSKEYKLGRKIFELKTFLTKGKIFSALRKIIIHKKIKKYECHQEIKNYVDNKPIKDKKIVIYSCNVGNYDSIKEPFYKNASCEYIYFTDNDKIKSENWEIRSIPEEIKRKFNYDGTLINRYYKLNPHIVFPDFDYAIYVDGTVKVVSDLSMFINNIDSTIGIALYRHSVRKCIYDEYEACKILKKGNTEKLKLQLDKYKEEGFPKDYGMLECGLIVSDLINKNSQKIFNQWFNEFIHSASLRDQIALPYILWKNHVETEKIGTLGNNIYNSQKFIVYNHRN